MTFLRRMARSSRRGKPGQPKDHGEGGGRGDGTKVTEGGGILRREREGRDG